MTVIDHPPDAAAAVAQRRAMQSVYCHSLWRTFEQRGAPAVLLPQRVRPLPLEQALPQIAPERRREALWTLVRGWTPPLDVDECDPAARYPAAIRQAAATAGFDIDAFELDRLRFRVGAQAFAAALVAYVRGDHAYEELRGLFDERRTLNGAPRSAALLSSAAASQQSLGVDDPARSFGGTTIGDYLQALPTDPEGWSITRKSLIRLENEVGVDLHAFMAQYADSVAFLNRWPIEPAREEALVYPATTVAVQDPSTLTTKVTVTALVKSDDFDSIKRGIDPQSWTASSDVFERATFVPDARRRGAPARRRPLGASIEPGDLDVLHETVNLRWGAENEQLGWFDNRLNISEFTAGVDDYDREVVDLKFSLNDSIRSRVLWDERIGGITVDEGFVRARPIAPRVWRVTSRKWIGFSDRTPYSGGDSWFDIGKTLSYLAPATLSWWIESEMYASGHTARRNGGSDGG